MEKKYLVPALLLICAVLAPGIDIGGPELTGGVLGITNADDDSAAGPLVPAFGIDLPLAFTERFGFVPGVQFFGTDYFVRDGRALPAETEKAEAVWAAGILLHAPFTMSFPLGQDLVLRTGCGGAVLLRFPVFPRGGADSGELLSAFYSSGGFLYGQAGATLIWQAIERAAFLARADLLAPVFHAWDGRPWSDGWVFTLRAGIRLTGRQNQMKSSV